MPVRSLEASNVALQPSQEIGRGGHAAKHRTDMLFGNHARWCSRCTVIDRRPEAMFGLIYSECMVTKHEVGGRVRPRCCFEKPAMEGKIVGFLAAEAPHAGSGEVFCIGHRSVKPVRHVEIVEPIRSGRKIAAVFLDMLDGDRTNLDICTIRVGDRVSKDSNRFGDPFVVMSQRAVCEMAVCSLGGVEPGVDGVVILPAAAMDSRGRACVIKRVHNRVLVDRRCRAIERAR